jgi:hypothetical protein
MSCIRQVRKATMRIAVIGKAIALAPLQNSLVVLYYYLTERTKVGVRLGLYIKVSIRHADHD